MVGVLAGMMLAGLAGLGGVAGPIAYTFEGLSLGALGGQDGWSGTATGSQVALGSVAPNLTRVVTSTVDSSRYRSSGGAFIWPTYSSSDTAAEFLVEFRPGNETNAGVLLSFGTSVSNGFAFGMWGSKFSLGTAGQGYGSVFAESAFGLNPWNIGPNTDWYRVRLLVDFTANGGGAAAWMSYMNLTAGDTSFSTVGMNNLQNVNLNLLGLADVPSRNPANWSRMTLRLEVNTGAGIVPEVDNLTPYVAADPPAIVPEPSALLLLCLAVALRGVQRRRGRWR